MFVTIREHSNVMILCLAIKVSLPISMACSAEYPNLSFSGISKSRCQLSYRHGSVSRTMPVVNMILTS